ncbi:MAG TPA: hypothetical protein VIG33_06645 [Pseudobdellovibrionaceae bacterium]|jgi:hypothetical protein
MNKAEIVIAMYRPHDGKLNELEVLVRKPYSTLKEYGLATTREPFIGRSMDGSILEVFEWVSSEAAEKAHDHPAVAKIWEAMAMVCDFGKLNELPEAKNRFPHFHSAF